MALAQLSRIPADRFIPLDLNGDQRARRLAAGTALRVALMIDDAADIVNAMLWIDIYDGWQVAEGIANESQACFNVGDVDADGEAIIGFSVAVSAKLRRGQICGFGIVEPHGYDRCGEAPEEIVRSAKADSYL